MNLEEEKDVEAREGGKTGENSTQGGKTGENSSKGVVGGEKNAGDPGITVCDTPWESDGIIKRAWAYSINTVKEGKPTNRYVM